MNNADAMLITLFGMSQDLKCTIDLKFDEMGLHCIISKDDHHREFVIGKYTLSNLFDPASCLIAQINNDAAELNVEIIKDKHKPTLMDESVWAYAKKHQSQQAERLSEDGRVSY